MANAANNLDRQLEGALENLLKFLGRTIAGAAKGIWGGIKKLNKWQTWLGLGIAAIITVLAKLCQTKILNPESYPVEIPWYVCRVLYVLLLASPAIYLFLLGNGQSKGTDYEKLFTDIGFLGKDGKCPKFCGCRVDGKKRILSFKSYIPLNDWIAAKPRLETALDCTILKIEYGKSKRLVLLTTLPADFKIPENVNWKDEYCSRKNGVLTIGQSALGNISFDLNRVPHVLAAGETGSGKSVILRCMLWQLIQQGSRVFMIDFKGGVEFGKQYERFGEVITDRERALEVLDMLVQENSYRLQIFRDLEVKNLAEYNRKTGQNLCRIGVFTDEIAEMLDKKGVSKEDKKIYEALEGRLSTLARLSRATGINLFLGVQRPDASVLTGQIKNNVPVRICGRFADKTASEIVLGNTDAVTLPDIKGRFLYKVGNETIEFQAFYFDDDTMLHDVDVEVGDMLTEAPVYHPGKQRRFEEKPEKEEKPKNKPSGRSRFQKKGKEANYTQETTEYSDSDVYQDVEEELPFGDPMEMDDYDFDFFRDRR